jgi:hypothetical protein
LPSTHEGAQLTDELGDADNSPDADANADLTGAEVIGATEGGVRVFWVAAPRMQDLVSRLAVVLGEHMTDYDELHVTYNAMQSGWQQHDAQPRRLTRPPRPAWTELQFEYSAFVVLRQLAPCA